MRLIFFYAEKGYERALGPALSEGAARHGDTVEMRPLEAYERPEHDGSIICGVVKREVLWDHQAKGRLLLYADKGFTRERTQWRGASIPAWWRICIGAVHPTAYLMRQTRPFDRLGFSGLLPLAPRRTLGKRPAVLIAGSSAKFHETMRLEHPTIWAGNLVADIRRLGPWPVIYRPKPSWSAAEPVDGAIFDHNIGMTLGARIERGQVRAVVTYGSIASVDAIRLGTPCIVLGNAPAAAVSGSTIDELIDPPWFSEAERLQWAANLAYQQFTPQEIASGEAWRIIRENIDDAL